MGFSFQVSETLETLEMSELPRSAACLTQANGNDNFQRENFHEFFECWLVQQSEHLKDLQAACEKYQARTSPTPHAEGGLTPELVDESVLRSIIEAVIEHYEQYYRGKSAWAKHDAPGTFSPSWRSSMEGAFSWMGGWHPSVAIHLLYTKSGLQHEGEVTQLFRRLPSRDLGNLSANQLSQVDDLQKRTVRLERQITDMMVALQETVADSSMVELSDGVTDMLEETLRSEEDGLEELLHTADELRLRTMKAIVDILTPIQAVHFLIAAAELHLRLHEWGGSREGRQEQQDESDPVAE